LLQKGKLERVIKKEL